MIESLVRTIGKLYADPDRSGELGFGRGSAEDLALALALHLGHPAGPGK